MGTVSCEDVTYNYIRSSTVTYAVWAIRSSDVRRIGEEFNENSATYIKVSRIVPSHSSCLPSLTEDGQDANAV